MPGSFEHYSSPMNVGPFKSNIEPGVEMTFHPASFSCLSVDSFGK